MEFIMIRHGESEGNARLTESRDPVLTPLGREQAARAGRALAGLKIDRFLCSPQHRSMETASIIAEMLDLSIHMWSHLAERGFSGDEPGHTRSEIERLFPRVVLTGEIDEEGCLRRWGSETPEALDARMAREAEVVRAWADSGEYERIACVSHGTSGRTLLRHLLRIPAGANVAFAQRNCGIHQIRFLADGGIIVNQLNRQDHLEGLPRSTQPPQEAAS